MEEPPEPETLAPGAADSPPRDLLLVAALDELRARSAEAEVAHTTREAELEAAVAARTSELEAAYELAAREHARLRDVVERLQDGILAVNEHFEIEFANPAAAALFSPVDVSPGAPLPEHWSDFAFRDFAAALFEPDAIPEEARIATTDRTFNVSGIPAYRSVAILVLADVSARERRERAEREFVVNAAHELRTPLAAILTAVEALQRAKDDPALRDTFLGHLERQSARLGRLAEALLTLARAQMGVELPRQTVVEVLPLLERAAAEIHPAATVEVSVECPPELAVFGHPELLEQALANLASNAAKHTSHGEISLRGRPASRGRVVIEITDTGSGIRSADRARATERFYRAGAEPGFGLGLAIAREAAEALSGRLELEGTSGGGTTARLILRAAQLVTRG
ncbi:MAG: PAS domain-containing sensor histidine kinase [Actinomycetota bacterium]|nr:PAS domain-containing sensor histidine kinase [Actinomycetota bacterium]